MAFDYTKFQKSTQGDAIDVNTIWIYTKTDETLAAIAVAGYFNDVNGIVDGVASNEYLQVNDIIWIVGSDGATFASVTVVTPNVTTVAFSVVLGAGSVGTANIVDGAVTGAKLAALPSAQILVGSAGNVATAVAMTGDVAISNAGVTTIQAGSIDLAMLSAGITPSHVVKFAAQETTVGGAAAEAFNVVGIAATDLAFVQVVDEGTNTVTVIQAVCTLNTLTVTFSADPGNDAVINYQILRAAA